MSKIKKGDIVTRNSYNNDIVFCVKEIIKPKEMSPIAVLKGVTIRIEATAYIEDLKVVDKNIFNREIERFENNIKNKTNELLEEYLERKNSRKFLFNNNGGKILHLDGDRNYAEKSAKVYDKFNLRAIVKSIRENRQPYEIRGLLDRYNPDIVIITGHDGMIKKGYNYNDIYNYRNSKYFVKTVEEARRWEQGENRLAIFAGACQSYYEAIMEAGANFASSPARILIDFMDPLIIAQKIAITPSSNYITMKDIRDELKNGEKGVSGIGTFGKLE